MYCDAVDGFYLKANGEVPCWCSPGEHYPLFKLDTQKTLDDVDIMNDLLNSRVMRSMREALYHNQIPFDYCKACGILTPDQPDSWDHINKKTFQIQSLRMFQVESSYLCNVDCPLCIRLNKRKETKDPPYNLPFSAFKKTVDDLCQSGTMVQQICFSGRGDPFMAPELPKMVRYSKEKLGCFINCHTNANFPFKEEYLACGFDEIDFSLDGVTQESYERYRRGGCLDTAIRFAADFAAAKQKLGLNRPVLGWKMVLFEWNSSDEHIQQAVEWAEELGLDRILLVDTDTPGGISYRDKGKRLAEIEALVAELRLKSKILILIQGYSSIYSVLPEVEVQTRIYYDRHNGRKRTVLLGRLFNHLLEEKSVHVRVELEDESGQAPKRLLDADFNLAERSELIDSMEIVLNGRESNRCRVKTTVSNSNSGIVISETAIDL